MNQLYLWILTAMVTAVAAGTISRFWSDRSKFCREELHEEDRLFVWRIVLFLIYPALVAIDLRATIVCAQLFGGSVKHWSYALFSYSATPEGISNGIPLLLVLFAGTLVQLALAISLLPSLFFRPHPFLSTVIGYTIVTILGSTLIAEPLLSLIGVGGSRWHLVATLCTPAQKLGIEATYVAVASIFLVVISLERLRLWFADLSRPVIAEKLRDALMQARIQPGTALTLSRLALLYERAGLPRQAKRKLKLLLASERQSLYAVFTYAVLKYRDRKYKAAREGFLLAADYQHTDPVLRGSFLSAAACAAFAQGDTEGALNLSERALEFDDASLVARMVKVDVFLRTGRKEQAGDEIISAVRRGLDMDLESKVPLDVDRVLQRIYRLQVLEKRPTHSTVS